MKKLILISIILSLFSCREEPVKIINALLYQDTSLPVLLDMKSLDERSVELVFSKPISMIFSKSPDNNLSKAINYNNSIKLSFEKDLPLEREHVIYLSVKDKSQNILSLSIGIRGKNSNIPCIVINEFLSKGTETQPNRIEFEVRKSGNLSGLYLCDAIKGYEKFNYTFPNIDVYKGQYIILYINNIPNSEFNTISNNKNIVYLEAKSEVSFQSTNGMCILYDTKMGEGNILDSLVYISNTASTYSNFGKMELEKSYEYLLDIGAWVGEPVDTEKATSTRTVCRYSYTKDDTNSRYDFYIADTRTSSFGYRNPNIEFITE